MLASDHGPAPGKSPGLLGGKLRGLCSVLLLPDAVDTARFLSLLKLPSSDGGDTLRWRKCFQHSWRAGGREKDQTLLAVTSLSPLPDDIAFLMLNLVQDPGGPDVANMLLNKSARIIKTVAF